jgi:simple sugar transport system substrate-binding protein
MMSSIVTNRGWMRMLSTVFIVILVIGLSACTTKKQATSTTHQLTFAVITDGAATDPFWSEVQQGVAQAARKMSVITTYQAANPFSDQALTNLIDAAVATKPDGLVIAIPDCNGLTPAIKRAQLVGISVISIDSGNTCASQLGFLNAIGQAGYQAGLASGQRLVAAGAKNVLCINQGVGTPDLDDRCRGIHDALAHAGKKSEVLGINLSNPATVQQIQTTLAQNRSIDSIITLSPAGAAFAISALQELNLLGHIKLATFDVSSAVLQVIQQGDMLFAFDQKPYFQGYLPITLLTQYKQHLPTATTSLSSADPAFVTIANVQQAEQSLTPGTP